MSVELERPLAEWLTVTAHWRYFNDHSNTQVYDYDRHIVGALLSKPTIRNRAAGRISVFLNGVTEVQLTV